MPFGIVEHGMGDLDFNISATQRIVCADPFAMPAGAIGQETQRDPVTQRGREGDRADEPLVVLQRRRITDIQEMRACVQTLGAIYGLDTHEHRSVWCAETRAAGEHLADEVLFLDISLPSPRSAAVVVPLISFPAA